VQLWHALPPKPHALFSVPGSQVSKLQHPAQPENVSQRHWPLTQRVPGAQGRPVPHRHWPPAQVSAVVGSHDSHAAPQVSKLVWLDAHTLPWQQPPSHDAGVHTHCVPLHAVPAGHGPPVPQPHVPPSRRHTLPTDGLQAVQAAPFWPHALDDGVVQVPLLPP
jgi:hypothetical protein